jgi:DNA-directed RNA polymerase specialized sigma24 family protein
MEHCMEEANLGQYDTLIAMRYLLDQWAQIDIAAELGWTRSTISTRIPRILSRVEQTATRLQLT